MPPAEGADGARPTILGRHQKVLDAIAWWNVARVARPSRIQVAFIAGHSAKSGTFEGYIGECKTAGFVDNHEGRTVALTDAGLGLARRPDRPATTSELQARVMERLPERLWKPLRAMIACYPEAMSRTGLAEESGHGTSSGTFEGYVGQLVSLKLLEKHSRGQVRATDALFLE